MNYGPPMNNYGKKALALHKKLHGKIGTALKNDIKNRDDLSVVYTPGVAAVSSHLGKNPQEANLYTIKSNSIAVVSDGSAVLGLGNIGPEGALPVMEGKAAIFKKFAGIDAWPIVLKTQNPKEIIETIINIAPGFGAINLEDISAPKCFEIEEELRNRLDIPVLHDDQWGTAVVVLAGLINALKVVKKKINTIKIVMSGAGAAGSAIAKLLIEYGAKNIILIDRAGVIFRGREGNTPEKEMLARITNPSDIQGELKDAVLLADVFIGVSSAGLLSPAMVTSMKTKSIVFAMANPVPEIMPNDAKNAGAYIVATGRSDFNNQINNALAFPGIFRGALDNKVKNFTTAMLIHAAENIASLVKRPTREKIVPTIFDKNLVKEVSKAIVQ